MKVHSMVRSESGASAILVAIVVVVLFGFTALAVDVARMFEERRELQRTADVSALSGASAYASSLFSGSSSDPAAVVNEYITDNPATVSAIDERNVDVPPEAGGTCTYSFEGVDLPCVYSKVTSNDFRFVFAGVLGDQWKDPRPVTAEATVVVGAGAPGGDKLVPWMVRDCPRNDLATDPNYPQYAAEDDPTVVAFATGYGCPYQFSGDYVNGPFVGLFLGTGSDGNYQGADLNTDSATNCPPVDGYFNEASNGADAYREFLGLKRFPCSIFPGARLHSKTGGMSGPTSQGLADRKIGTCINNPGEFDDALDPADPDDPTNGVVRINHWNPCMVALVLVVHTQGTDPKECLASQGKAPPPGTAADYADKHPDLDVKEAHGDIVAMQREIYPIVKQGQNCIVGNLADGRFGPFVSGTSRIMLIRRVALFYIVNKPEANKENYDGLFLKAIDSQDSDLGPGQCNAESSICVVKLVG
jgi:hypothetical protein